MRKILFTLASLTAVAFAQEIDICTKSCGQKLGACLNDTFDVKSCIEATGDCTLECFQQVRVATFKSDESTTDWTSDRWDDFDFGVKGHHEHHHKHHFDAIEDHSHSRNSSNYDNKNSKELARYGDMGTCQKDCGIDYAKCMIQSLAIIKCAQDEASCALDCLKGVPFTPKYDKNITAFQIAETRNITNTKEMVRYDNMLTCQKDCAIDYAKCLITTGLALIQCAQQEAGCALDCLKGKPFVPQNENPVALKNSSSELARYGDMGTCQKDCGIDYAKCMIQSLAIIKCAQDEASCALDCLKGVPFTPKYDGKVPAVVKTEKEIKQELARYGDMGTCQKDCGIDYAKCMIQSLAIIKCAQDEASCALDCLKGSPHNPQQNNTVPAVINVSTDYDYETSEEIARYADKGTCQKDCGIDYAKCMIQSLAIIKCAQDEASCALDCLKGIPFTPKYDKVVVKTIANVEGTQEVCQQNCGISYGQCLIETFDMDTCTRKEASCSLGCFKQIAVSSVQVKSTQMEVCQENCGISYGQCLIQTFDMQACLKAEAVCALECVKQVQTHVHHPHVTSLKCSACKMAAGKVEGIIAKWGCGLADAAITGACEAVFLGPEDPLADACAVGFIAACPTLSSWIAKKTFTPDRACQLIHMC